MNCEHLLRTRHCAVCIRKGVGGWQGCGVGQGGISCNILSKHHGLSPVPSLTVAPLSLSMYP